MDSRVPKMTSQNSTRRRFIKLTGGIGLLTLGSNSVIAHEQEAEDHNDAEQAGAEDHTDDDDHSFNHADIHFMQMMIPHHEQAIEMSELVPFRTNRQELIEMAEEIIEEQEAEILQMSEWLVEVSENPYAYLGMDHEEMMDEMEEMHSPEEMEQLRSLEGQAFDLTFISLMIDHHQGAIRMAEEVLAAGNDPKVAQLAEEIIESQEAEIEQLRAWCREWRS